MHNLHLWLVDDDKLEHEAFRRAFKRSTLSCSITCCSSADEALQLLRSQHRPHGRTFLFLDINMPRMSGLELLEVLLREKFIPGLMTFVMSTSTAPRDIEAAYRYPINGYMSKAHTGENFQNLVALLELHESLILLPET